MGTDSLTQVQDTVATVAAEVKATVAQPAVAEAVDKFANVGWGDMGLMTLLGFSVVFVVLVLLIFIMKGMGAAFTRQKRAKKAADGVVAVAVEEEHEAISDQEIAAAIMTALKLYKSNLHDQESEMITIHRIARAYSPWSSKIHGLTQLPERK
jgi:sodium pump decarboxylase gamma subunit